ncbi:hypothetical protein, partial [Aeromonas salmonicida]|uniref:hypothetical protein n=1 Tax=Aeromonas salmonicida TaxID=645 RepID=UPI003D30F5B8
MYKRQEDASPDVLTDSGVLTVTDVDGADEAKFVAGAGTPSADALGSLTLTEGGASFSYTPLTPPTNPRPRRYFGAPRS